MSHLAYVDLLVRVTFGGFCLVLFCFVFSKSEIHAEFPTRQKIEEMQQDMPNISSKRIAESIPVVGKTI